jgi:DNA polymerase-3 subunit epsilon
LHLPTLSKYSGDLPGGWLGLGRSIFGLLPSDSIERGRSLLQLAVERGQSAPTTGFMTTPEGGHTLRVTMAPVFSFRCHQHGICLQCERRQMTGFVLTLEDLSSLQDESDTGGALTLADEVREERRVIPLTPSPPPRPVYYEFDLFNQRGLQELGTQTLRKLTYVVFDTETTGLNPAQGDEIIQIGAVRIVNGRILQEEVIDQLVDPKRSVPEASVAIHGITPDMVVGQPTIEQVLPHFHRFVEGAVLVAHNAAFDMRCLQLKEGRTGIRFDNPVLDTLLLSSVIHPHQETHSIDGIAARLNVTIVGRHTALGDALVTAEVLLKLIPLLEARGILTLEDALHASTNSRYAKLTY